MGIQAYPNGSNYISIGKASGIIDFGVNDSGPSAPIINPSDLGFDFWADMLDSGTFVYSSSNVVEQVINKASVGVVFPEKVTNGLFPSNVTGWTASTVTLAWDATNGGSMKQTNGGAAFNFSSQDITTVIGKQYRIKASAVGGTVGSCKVQILDVAGGTFPVNVTKTGATNTFDSLFNAIGTNSRIRLVGDSVNGSIVYWDNVSFVEVDAEVQTDTTKQPLLVSTGINAQSALLFDGSNDFLDSKLKYVGATFTKFATILFDTSTTNTAYIIGCATNASHSLHVIKSGSSVIVNGSSGEGITYTITLLDAQNAITIIECVDTSGDKELYINGVLVDTSSAVDTHTDLTWMIGSHSTAGSTVCYKGHISDHGIKTAKLSSGDVALLDRHQRLRWRVPANNSTGFITVSTITQSNSVGFATVISDAIAAGLGLNYIPSIKHFRNTNDQTGEGYSQSTVGSHWPATARKFNELSGKKLVHVSTGKTATSVATESAFVPGDRLYDWDSGSPLRDNFLLWTSAMLANFGRTNLDWCVFNIGERDVVYMASDPLWTKALFKAKYLALINFVKSNYPGVKILLVQTVQGRNTVGDTALNTTQWTWVIEAQQELAASESNVFLNQSTVGATITNGKIESGDGIHYTKAFNVVVGESIATTINSNL